MRAASLKKNAWPPEAAGRRAEAARQKAVTRQQPAVAGQKVVAGERQPGEEEAVGKRRLGAEKAVVGHWAGKDGGNGEQTPAASWAAAPCEQQPAVMGQQPAAAGQPRRETRRGSE